MKLSNKENATWLLGQAIPNGTCLDCHYATPFNTYPKVSHSGSANRFIWAALKGPIPEGLWVLHTCDNKQCININHLFLGTRQDNVDDMMNKGRHKSERPRLITNAQKIQLLELHEQGWSYSQLGAKYMVTKQTIYKYVKGYR